jgi:hypothetical protein
MKRKRLWWIAGVGLLVVLIALGWLFSGDSRPPAVSVTVVGFTNRPVLGSTGPFSEVVAVLEVSNRSPVTLELSASLSMQAVERSSSAGAVSVISVELFPGDAAPFELVMPRVLAAPYWVDATYESLTPSERMRQWLSQGSGIAALGRVARLLPPPVIHRRRFGPFTNYPPRELFANTVQARLEALNSSSTNAAAWSAMVRTNVLLLGTNKPPAEVNPGGGLKRLEF